MPISSPNYALIEKSMSLDAQISLQLKSSINKSLSELIVGCIEAQSDRVQKVSIYLSHPFHFYQWTNAYLRFCSEIPALESFFKVKMMRRKIESRC
jgi:hypothetical protein